MSEIIIFEASGTKDFGSITPEEISLFCIEHNVNKINSMMQLWKCTRVKDEKEEIVFEEIVYALKMVKDGWEIQETNKWEIDIN